MTILSFIGVFAALGPLSGTHDGGAEWLTVAPMVAGVFVGSAAWWLCLSGTTTALGWKMPAPFMHGIARLSAVAIAVFGVVQMISGLRHFI
jgi:hypothetical protein